MEELIWPAINVSILIGILFWLLRAPVKQFVHQRHQRLKTELNDTREKLKEAKNAYEEYTSKLKAIEAEERNIHEQYTGSAQEEKEQIIKRAERNAETIRKDMDTAIKQMNRRLKNELIQEFGLEIIGRVENKLAQQLTQDDQKRFRKAFSYEVGASR